MANEATVQKTMLSAPYQTRGKPAFHSDLVMVTGRRRHIFRTVFKHGNSGGARLYQTVPFWYRQINRCRKAAIKKGPTVVGSWKAVGRVLEGVVETCQSTREYWGLIMPRNHILRVATVLLCAASTAGCMTEEGRSNLDKSSMILSGASQRDIAWYDANRTYQKSAADYRACLAANGPQACENKRLLMEADERVLRNTSQGNVGVTVSGR
jgi:hypothetical protein